MAAITLLWSLKGFILKKLAILLFTTLAISGFARDLKILVLIIASDNLPVYVELLESWKKYMHSDPDHFEVYFLRGDENLHEKATVEGDTIWAQTDEGYVPASGGILKKTILALEVMVPRLHEFDYVLRTNLSSFYVFPRLLAYLRTMPRKRCYTGSKIGDWSQFGSGCGFIVSTDLAYQLATQGKSLIGIHTVEDDVMIGRFLRKKQVRLIPHDRINILKAGDIDRINRSTSTDIFHFRVKHPDDVRLYHDIYTHDKLFEIFYK